MRAMGKRSISSLISVVLTVALFGVSVAMVIVTVLLLITPWVPIPAPERPGHELVLGVPTAFSVEASRVSAPSIGVTAAEIRDAEGVLRIPVSAPRVYVSGLAAALLLLAIAWFGVSQLRKVVHSLRDERPFVAANATRIRRVAYAVIGLELLRATMTSYANIYVAEHFQADGLRFIPSFDLSLSTIVVGLIIFVLAEVFRAGASLEEERSLTI